MRQTELLGLDKKGLEAVLAEWNEPAYRAAQLYTALYAERRRDLLEISTLPIALRERLAAETQITWPEIEKEFNSVDGTRRYLLRLPDNETIEAVLMPDRDRDTICISTQAGCPVNCGFCLTALLGLKRNLTPGEIIGQVLVVADRNGLDTGEGERQLNLVFMGMGEPLLNYNSVMQAVRLLADPKGIGLSPRRMTLSTSGIVNRIADMGKEPVRPKIAVSLNATTDEVRTKLIPHNKKWPLAVLLEACRNYPLRSYERMTFEYVLLDGVNDTTGDARRLVKLTNGMRSMVNLIALNPGPELPYRVPPPKRVLAFQKVLLDAGMIAFIRKSRGLDIFAACGQLKRTLDPAQELALLHT